MRTIVERLEGEAARAAGAPALALTLTFDDRKKRRHPVRLSNGEEVALVLPRGTVLVDGDLLRCDDGALVAVSAAPETLSSVETADGLLFARVAYHLGNRHVPLQITAGMLRYQHDHVLDDLVRALGLEVRVVEAPFQPEAGAYGGRHGHEHGHEGGHEHEHADEHAHGHEHGQRHGHGHGHG